MADRATETERRPPEVVTTPPAVEATPPAGHATIPTAGGASASDRGFAPEIEATPQALGAHTVAGMNKANVAPGSGGLYGLQDGIHYWYNYKNECERAGHPNMWKDEYHHGHTQAKQFINPH